MPVNPKDTQWPKTIPELTETQKRVRDDWMEYWHYSLPNSKFGVIESFNQNYPVRAFNRYLGTESRVRTLEIGAGLGGHIPYEDLARQDYMVLELRDQMAVHIKESFPAVHTFVGDIQQKTEFEEGCFDRVVAIHVLEHLPDLPRALEEIHRVLRPGGIFNIVIPCEGGLAYNFSRRISSKRMFDRKFGQYGMDYLWMMRKTEHINEPAEILYELKKRFKLQERRYFPLMVPINFCNLCIGLTAIKG